MRQILTVTAAAADLHLLTVDEMRAAAGITGSGSDAALQAMSLKIAAAITAECNISVGGGAEPTLKKETLSETFRFGQDSYQRLWPKLVLGRRHNVAVTSVTVDGVILDSDDFEVEPEHGLLYRLYNDRQYDWCARKVVVVYDAGFTTIPSDLKMAATDFFRLAWLEQSRDPSKKRDEVDIPGVAHTVTDFWVGSIPGQSSEGSVPDIVAGQLQRYRNIVI
jgi:hypothetical protein